MTLYVGPSRNLNHMLSAVAFFGFTQHMAVVAFMEKTGKHLSALFQYL